MCVKFSLYDVLFLVRDREKKVLCCMDVKKALRGIREQKNMERKRESLSKECWTWCVLF